MTEGRRSDGETPLALPARRARTSLAAGDRVGAWTVAARLASGGFGTVYRVTGQDAGGPDRVAALKVLHPEVASSPDVVTRFRREADAVRSIAHDGVVELVEVGELPDGRPYFVMELLAGEDLRTTLSRDGALAAADAIEIVSAVAAALEVAHAHGIVHRDLKPSNVFLAQRADGGRRVVLLDFGVAKLLDDGGQGLTRSREAIGSPSSMAPEQIRGGRIDARADVYGLGALAFAILTGAMPFADVSAAMLPHMHLYVAPPRVSTIAPVPRSFDAVIARALDKDPARRQQSAAALAAALRDAAGHTREATAAGDIAIVVVDAGVERAALVDPDDALFDDIDAVLALAVERLVPLGFESIEETADTITFRAVGQRAGSELEELVADLGRELAARGNADPRVHPRVELSR